MAIPIVESNAVTDVTSNSSSAVITLPSGVTTDDIIIIICALDGTGHAPSATGYTLISGAGADEGTVALHYLWKRAGASESNPTVNWTGSEQGRFMTLRISGCWKNGSPLDDDTNTPFQETNSVGSISVVTATFNDTLLIAAVAVDRDRVDSGDGVFTGNGHVDVGVAGSSGGANGAGLCVARLGQAGTGSFLGGTFGTWEIDGVAGNAFNLRPTGGEPTASPFSQGVIIA